MNIWENRLKWLANIMKIHFIGICGVAMSAVATALHEQGHNITGSDAGFFPPVSTQLTKLGIPYYSGWHPEKMTASGTPDLVIVGNAVSGSNPELVYVQENKIPFISYPEALGKFLIKENSIVVAGTYGKTTSSALLAHIFTQAGLKPSYMTGGLIQSDMASSIITSGKWSIVEGDEYFTAKWDRRAKFFHYKPTHLLISAVKWDHADVYPTESSYFDAFRRLIDSMPSHGIMIACGDTKTLPNLLKQSGKKYISYGNNKNNEYVYSNVKESRDGLTFEITHGNDKYEIVSPLIGAYNAENITGCFAMAISSGISADVIISAIKTFKGMKRRMEKRYDGDITVIDDIAHSPEKARSVLNSLRHISTGMVVAVYEPNSGNRTAQSLPGYEDAFKDADTVVIPRLTRLKVDPNNPEQSVDGNELAQAIKKSHKDVNYFEDDEKLVDFLVTGRNKGDVIAFLGSHGFRGMIEQTIDKLSNRK